MLLSRALEYWAVVNASVSDTKPAHTSATSGSKCTIFMLPPTHAPPVAPRNQSTTEMQFNESLQQIKCICNFSMLADPGPTLSILQATLALRCLTN